MDCKKCPIRYKCESAKAEHLLPLLMADVEFTEEGQRRCEEKLDKICPLGLALSFQVKVLEVQVRQMQKRSAS